MSLKIGDKVKFLNASGGGLVARIIDSRMVSVLIEDGFEIPTMISELIQIEPSEPAARFFEDHYRIDKPSVEPSPVEPEDDRLSKLSSGLTASRKAEEIYLAFIPHDQKWLITGPVDVVLVNNSTYDVLYNIFSKNAVGHYAGVDYGSVLPDSKLVIATINREQLTHWTEGCLQFLFHRDQVRSLLPPFNSEFRIEGKRFYKEGNYRDHPMIQAKGIVVKVLSLTEYFLSSSHPETEQPPKTGSLAELPLIVRHQVAPKESVVDLHIHELVEDPANLEKSEILEFQRNYFLKCMDSAIVERFRKVIFIHGIGNGVLRTVITELLKKQEGIEFFDAPLAKFGNGALEVRFRQQS